MQALSGIDREESSNRKVTRTENLAVLICVRTFQQVLQATRLIELQTLQPLRLKLSQKPSTSGSCKIESRTELNFAAYFKTLDEATLLVQPGQFLPAHRGSSNVDSFPGSNSHENLLDARKASELSDP